jgi:imidazolonepropionase-like amidohydrolase
MDREAVLPHQTVLVRDGVITEVGPVSEVQIPAGVRRIPGSGRFLTPGLTDAHVHLLSTTELPLYLANGVTTVFNLEGRPAHLLWRGWIEGGQLLGPRIFTSGPMFNVPRTAEEDVRLVDEQAALGYDAVKVYVQVSREEYPALIAEAKRKHLLLMGHIPPGPGFDAALEAGQSIAHLEEFTYTFFNPWHDSDDTHVVYDEAKIPLAAAKAAKAGVFVTATLSTYRDIVEETGGVQQYLKRPELKYLAPWTRAALQPSVNRYATRNSPQRLAQLTTSLAFQRKLLLALQQAGVPLLCGTDATQIGPVAGFAIHEELAEMVRSGLTPFQALQSATVNATRYFGRSSEFGAVRPGQRADLLLLTGNPLEHIDNTRRIAGVMVKGHWYEAATLEQLKEGIPSQYDHDLASVVKLMKSDPGAADRYLHERDPLNFLGSAALAEVMASDGAPALLRLVRDLRRTNSAWELASEETVNNLGYQLLGEQKMRPALLVFGANVEDFPHSANALDSLADGHLKLGDEAKAVELYRRALQLDPSYVNAAFAKQFIGEHTEPSAIRK